MVVRPVAARRIRHSPQGSWARHRRAAAAVVIGLALASTAGCASTVDSVDTRDYVGPDADLGHGIGGRGGTGQGWPGIATPAAVSDAPVLVPYPSSCQSPPSLTGSPRGC